MRLTDIAKELRITTQELRRELTKTNFGISTSAHEIDDALAAGVIRFLKGKVKPTLKKTRSAVVFKDDKEIKVEKEETKEEKEAREQKGEEEAEEKEEVSERAKVPKAGENYKKEEKKESTSINVNRRIELDQKYAVKPAKEEEKKEPHYKTAGKKKRRKTKGPEEDLVLESMQRHPHVARKVKIAKVTYGAGDEELTAEEIEIEREKDREAFKDQKKHRAVSQKRGPKAQPQIKAKVGTVEIPSIISVKEFSEKCGIPVPDVIGALLKNGVMATINQQIDYDTAEIIAVELGVELKRAAAEATSEELFEGDLTKLLAEDDKKNLVERPPVISVMGHVDHGKTKLLDAIREANVVEGEAGGITQHIGAYQVEKNGHKITFLDTPGHEAFTSMRARGAKATDIAILVVAADEGVKPQTIEAINHAQEAGIPIVVAINKMDKPNANPDKVKGELVEHGLQAEDWGGKNIMVPVSAMTGEGIDDLLEMILLVAEVEALKANPNRLAVGTVVESHLDPSLGPVATILINTGTLNVGDDIVVGTTVGRVKVMHDHTGGTQKEAGPSAAVQLSGLSSVPHSGDILQAFKNAKTAKVKSEELAELEKQREESLSGSMAERIVSQINAGQMKLLKIVLKADTKGSLEAIMQALNKIKSDDVAIKVIHFGVGNIANTDIIMAAASQALLIGFHVDVSPQLKKRAEKEHVDIKEYKIIYKLTEDLTALLSGMLEPEINVIELGKLKAKQIVLDKKSWQIVGCEVTEGKVTNDAIVRVLRDGEELFESEIEGLKHVAEDVKELEKGSECGIKIKTPKKVEEGDILEAYRVEKIERSL